MILQLMHKTIRRGKSRRTKGEFLKDDGNEEVFLHSL